jgi:Nucleotidyl transferase AbiEii toxin, Type IV TA system
MPCKSVLAVMSLDFKRPHHQAIALVLSALDAELLNRHHCLFAGGTAITLLHGEYRESRDMDFLVSNLGSYRQLRELVRLGNSIAALCRLPLKQVRDVRVDQYGIRTWLAAGNSTIKFEIVFEGRINLAAPVVDNTICGIATLSPLDLLTSKLLANSDRWSDDGVFNRDVIDLAMMTPTKKLLLPALAKAEVAYGAAIQHDLLAAIDRLLTRERWLDRCMAAMAINVPKAVLWKNLKDVRRKAS